MPAPASMVPSMPMLMIPERSLHNPVIAPRASGVASTNDSLSRLVILVLGLSDRARLSTSTSGTRARALSSRAGPAQRRAAGGPNPRIAVSKYSAPITATTVGGWNPTLAGSGGGSKLNCRVAPPIEGATPAIRAIPANPNTSPVADWRSSADLPVVRAMLAAVTPPPRLLSPGEGSGPGRGSGTGSGRWRRPPRTAALVPG